jgi:predicted RNA-binding Zn-ribbon protein involved in translation (DUF1610 family)
MSDPPGLLAFLDEHRTEDECWQFLRDTRWGENGFECPNCGEDEHWGFIEPRKLFECYECRKQTSVTAGTILQDTKLNLHTWFLAIYHVVTTKKGITEPDLARNLDVHAETAHNVRQTVYRILRRVQHRPLDGLVEADETDVGGKRPNDPSGPGHQQTVRGRPRGEQGRRGREPVPCVRAGRGWGEPGPDRAGPRAGRLNPVDGQLGWLQVSGLTIARFASPTTMKRCTTCCRGATRCSATSNACCTGRTPTWRTWNVQPYVDAFTFRFNHRPFLGKGLNKALAGIVETVPRPNDRLKRSGQLGAAA